MLVTVVYPLMIVSALFAFVGQGVAWMSWQAWYYSYRLKGATPAQIHAASECERRRIQRDL